MKTFLLVLAALALPPLLYIPRADSMQYVRESMERKIRETDGRIQRDRSAQRKLAQFHEERSRLDSEMQKLLGILPKTIDSETVHQRVVSAAAISGVQLVGFEPYRPGIDHQFRYQWFAIEADGSAAVTAALLMDLDHAEPILAVSNLQVRKSAAGWHSRFFVETFALQ